MGGSTLDIGRTQALKEIETWSIEALDEDSARYFYHFSDVSLLEQGKKNFVIGRKGTGKTAIAEYISKATLTDSFSSLLSFKNFPFNLIYNERDDSFTTPNQYITVWEYVIYSVICNMMAKNPKVDYDTRTKLAKVFDLDVDTALSSSLKRITDRNFSLGILGLEMSYGSTKGQDQVEASISQRNDFLKNYIKHNAANSTYYIIFDALDEDYKDIFDIERKNKYFDLLIGLFKSCQNVRRVFENSNTKIIPLVFLRDDIFELCTDPDKNKWLDRAITLDWSLARLKNLIAFRLTRAIDPTWAPLPFDEVWKIFFSDRSVVVNRKYRRKEDLFRFMIRSTYNRPRDIIHYVRESAKECLNLGKDLITVEMVRDANYVQSQHMRREIFDEMHSIIENINDILDVISNFRKSILSQSDFKNIYDENFPSKNDKIDAESILKLLYHFNVIGNITTGNHQVYRYNSNSKKLNLREHICIHRGMLKSLDIV